MDEATMVLVTTNLFDMIAGLAIVLFHCRSSSSSGQVEVIVQLPFELLRFEKEGRVVGFNGCQFDPSLRLDSGGTHVVL